MKKRKIIHKEYQKFINKYNWKGINYPSGKGEWRMFKKSNLTIALKVLNAKKNEYINPPYISKHNLNHSFNDSKQRKMTLSFSKKIICIIKRNNNKTLW